MSMTIARAKTTHTNHCVNRLYNITMLIVIVFAIVSLFPRGITLNNQYTMLKLFSKFRGGPGDPPTTLFNVCGLK